MKIQGKKTKKSSYQNYTPCPFQHRQNHNLPFQCEDLMAARPNHGFVGEALLIDL